MFPTYTSVSHIIERKGTRPQKTFLLLLAQSSQTDWQLRSQEPLPTKVAFHKPQEPLPHSYQQQFFAATYIN